VTTTFSDSSQQPCQFDKKGQQPLATGGGDAQLVAKALDSLHTQAANHGLNLTRSDANDGGNPNGCWLAGKHWSWPLAWRAVLTHHLSKLGDDLENALATPPPPDPDSATTLSAIHTLPGGYQFDANRLQLNGPDLDQNQPLRLTGREGQLLLQLLGNPNGLSRQQVVEQWYGRESNVNHDSKIFETHLYRLRQKLAQLSPALLIENSANGYRLTLSPTPLI
jgi:hypothetical protein